jgi:hypothetical protein
LFWHGTDGCLRHEAVSPEDCGQDDGLCPYGVIRNKRSNFFALFIFFWYFFGLHGIHPLPIYILLVLLHGFVE